MGDISWYSKLSTQSLYNSFVLPHTAPCSDLPAPTNGGVSYNAPVSNGSRPINTTATYSCDPGYTLVGSTSTRACQSGAWSGSAPICQSKLWQSSYKICDHAFVIYHVDCPVLAPPINGQITYSSGSSTVRPIDTVATYSCDPGYRIVGRGTLTCQAGLTVGAWSSAPPTCECEDTPPRM